MPKQHPADCPITSDGIEEARRRAKELREFADFGIIVASPYLRCVQTAIVIADELDLIVLLDQELVCVSSCTEGFEHFGEKSSFTSWRKYRE